ncbi:MAG TPA: glutaredoxin family protein [Candidatus Hypogeohydataceae bacterium YC41]
MNNELIVFTQECCPKCVEAKKKLGKAGLSYKEINVDTVEGRAEFALHISRSATTPAFYFKGEEYSRVEDVIKASTGGGP